MYYIFAIFGPNVLAVFGIDDLIVAIIIGSATVGTAVYMGQQQKKAVKAQEKKASAAAEQELAFQRFLAGEAEIKTAKQMAAQQGQYTIERLFGQIAVTPAGPNVFTLPSTAPKLTITDQINQSIHNFVRGF